MYELYEVSENCYEVHSKFKGECAVQGTLAGVGKYMTQFLGIRISELEIAITEMLKYNANAAHFGYRKSFMFTYNRIDKKAA